MRHLFAAVAEYVRQTGQRLFLPTTNLRRVNAEHLGDLGGRLVALDGLMIELYFAKTSLRSTYGTAGSPLVVLLWVYYSAQLFYWGAEFTKYIRRPWDLNAIGSGK